MSTDLERKHGNQPLLITIRLFALTNGRRIGTMICVKAHDGGLLITDEKTGFVFAGGSFPVRVRAGTRRLRRFLGRLRLRRIVRQLQRRLFRQRLSRQL